MRVQVVVIGAGQAGLSAAYHLRRAGLTAEDYVVLDDSPGPGGAWQHRWDSLTVGQTHSLEPLPGLEMPAADPQARVSDVMSRYFGGYESEYELPVRRPVRVRAVREPTADDGTATAPEEAAASGTADRAPGSLVVETSEGTWVTRGVINATGTWQKPFWPACPGQGTFGGRQLHARHFRSAREFAGQHVIVVGGGTSAVQIVLQLAEVAGTTWVTRRPPEFVDAEFDDQARRAAVAEVDARTRAGLPPGSVVSATRLPLTPEYRRGIADGVLQALPMFARLTPDGVQWDPKDVPPAPERRSADAICWATGFRPNLDHLAPLRLRTRGGGIVMDGPQVVADPRVQLVGYGPSASLVGASRAARTAVRNLRRLLGL